ncbi:MAG: tetratricopeptide repeat protein [Planctomycetota bacterium]
MANIFGKYTIEKKLGQGGMGAVYLALDPALNRRVALKIITSNDPELLERFQREASAVAKLKHSNIIQVYETGTVPTGGSALNKQHYFTMDYIEGVSMEKLIATPDKTGIQDIARIIQQVASALHYAHSQGIIHRDIKPANILITKQGQAYIADFGLAKQLTGLDRSLTITGTAVGTPNYMSPEQAQGKKDEIGPRSDIFSLGATMYHCLTGRMAFDGNELYEVFSKVINVDPPGPSSIIKIIPKDLETICMKCLNKDKARRYQTAEELAQDLKRYLEGEAIAARPVSVITKFRLKVTKNKTASLSIAGAIVILAVVAISLLVSSSNKRQLIARYRQEANQAFDKNQFDQARAICNKLLVLSPGDEAIKDILIKCETIINEREAKKQQEEAQAKEAAAQAQRIVDLRAQAKAALAKADGAPTPDQKIQIAQEALAIDPTFGDAYQVIGYAHKDKKKWDKAYDYFTKAIKATPTLAYSYYARAEIIENIYGKPKEAIPDLEKVLELDPNSHIGWYAKGCIEAAKIQYDEAIKSYNKAIELYPEYGWAYINRGAAYSNKGEWDKAIADYSKGIELNPKFVTSYYNRGVAYNKKGEWDKAVADYTRTIELDPKHAGAYCGRGSVYDGKNELDKAIADYDRAIELDPRYTQARCNRGNAYSKKGELDKAIADYNRAIELDPGYTEAYSNLGVTCEQKGDLDKAIEYYTRAIELDPRHTQARCNRGNAYSRKGEWDKAIADYNRAIELDPRYAPVYCNRGRIYYQKGALEQAIADWTKAIELDPKEMTSYCNRGVAYNNRKEFEKAMADFKKVLEFAPNHPEAAQIRQTIEGLKKQLAEQEKK